MKYLICNGARHYQCWNAISLPGLETAQKITDKLLEIVSNLPDYDAEFLSAIQLQMSKHDHDKTRILSSKEAEFQKCQKQMNNLVALAKEGLSTDEIKLEIRELSAQLKELRFLTC